MIDISLNVNDFLIKYPETKGYSVVDQGNSSYFTMDSHFGTHVDAPCHFIENGKTIDDIDTNLFVGICQVVETDDLSYGNLKNVVLNSNRLFFKCNKELIEKNEFDENYIGFTEDGTNWLIENGVEVVGIDYLSIESYNSKDFVVHKKLLEKEIMIVESLNMNKINEGIYKYYCFPIKCSNEGSPARVFVERLK